MDRQLRRRGTASNLALLATRDRREALATVPLHVTAGLRRVINGGGYVLDEVLHHGWRKVEVEAPLFVVAPARSGTTMLFHLLAADPRFAATTTGQTLIRSITVLELLRRALDKQRGWILDAREQINAQMAQLDETHTLRIDRLEEDEGFFNDQFALLTAHQLYPRVYESLGILQLDDRPPRVRRAVMRKYRNFIKRVLYRAGPETTYLAKNVSHAGRIASLEQTFPDARYIHIVRDPLVQLPSALGLIRDVARYGSGLERPASHPYWKLMLEVLLDQHRRLLAWERELPAQRWLTLRYDDLVGDPGATVRRVYDHFQLPIGPEVEQALAAANERAPSFRKKRSYALADYGIEADEVREQLAEVYAAYGLDD